MLADEQEMKEGDASPTVTGSQPLMSSWAAAGKPTLHYSIPKHLYIVQLVSLS